ncbi:MFS transporter permease [bacterium SCGC AG-212-C10]|nr:MFS transporter permease [bacterium SCGC AG-212-C10]
MAASAHSAVGQRIFYGWYVVAGTFVVLFLGFGAAYSFSAFFPALRDEFEATRGDTALVFSISGFLYFSLGALTGPFADRVGPRRVVLAGVVLMSAGLTLASQANELWQVYATYSLGVGVGLGFAYVPTVGAIQRWFVRKRGSASGFGVTGIGLGTLAIPLLATGLIDAYGWRSAYLVLGIATLVLGGSAALLLDHSPQRRNLWPDGDPSPAGKPGAMATPAAGHTLKEALHARPFWLLYAAAVTSGFGLFIPFVHLVPYAKDHGISSALAALLIGMIGVGSTVGRLGIGAAADRFGRRPVLVAAFALMAASLAFWLVATSFLLLVLFAIWFGIGYGGYVALLPAMTADYFGGRSVGAIIGVLYTGAAFGALLGPTFAGAVYDLQDSYALPITFASAMNVIATACVFRLRQPAAR